MKIGIVGLGLIGGSMAKTIRKHSRHQVYACDRDASVMQQALSEESIHGVLTEEQLSSCNFLLIALYPAAAVSYLKENGAFLSPGTIVIDLCGVKKAVMYPLEALRLPAGVVYLGGHPMAGTEKSGYQNARDNLFTGASMILVPPRAHEGAPEPALRAAEEEALGKAEDFFLALGFGRITLTTPEEHDRVIAFTSQLAHVVSSAYVKSPTALRHYGFSAGSYKDLTRVARLNEEMWTELFLDNAESLAEEVDGIIRELTVYRDAIRGKDRERLLRLLREGRIRKEGIDSFENS